MNKILVWLLTCTVVLSSRCEDDASCQEKQALLRDRLREYRNQCRREAFGAYAEEMERLSDSDWKPTCQDLLYFGHVAQTEELFEQLHVFNDCLKYDKNSVLRAIISKLQHTTEAEESVCKRRWDEHRWYGGPFGYEFMLRDLNAKRTFLARFAKRMIEHGAFSECESELYGSAGALRGKDWVEGELKRLCCPDCRTTADIMLSESAHRDVTE